MKHIFLIGYKKIFSQNYFYRKNYNITNQSFLFEQIKMINKKKMVAVFRGFPFPSNYKS